MELGHDMIDKVPVRVTVGLAVYNGAYTLDAALDSLLSQTHTDFRLVISDNASTDETATICADYARRDSRIVFIRQPINIGADANFDFLLDHATSDYFMWAAADDTRSPDFIESNLAFLEAHADFVGSTCRVRFVGGDYDPIAMGDQTRDEGSAGERVSRFFDTWHANGRFYSLFRLSQLKLAKAGISRYLGSDWAVVVRLLAQGKLNRLPSGSVDLGRDGASSRKDAAAEFHNRPLHWFLPFYELALATRDAVRGAPLQAQVTTCRKLMRINNKAVRDRLNRALGRVT